MTHGINIAEALLRGRYSGAVVAHKQQTGIQIDTETLKQIRAL